MKKYLFWIATIALGVVACTDKDIAPSESAQPDQVENNQTAPSNLTTVKLATFAGNSSRISYEAGTRADGVLEQGELKLIATIDNPDESIFSTGTSGGRHMSATSVYYDENSETYYVTYHMQGNNYNTNLDTQTAGAIQSFKIADDGTVTLGDGFTSGDRDKEDFDFNHIYFDITAQRILAVGHNVKNGNQKNTNAIVGLFNPVDGTYTYSTVKTSEKDYDADGKSLGYKDAGDVNSILRPNDNFLTPAGWHFYLLATRKGVAAVSADENTLFQPVLTEDGINYFIPTPGSAKSISQGTSGSNVNVLYLSQDTSDMPEAYTTGSEAKIAHFLVNTKTVNPEADFVDQIYTLGHLGVDPGNIAFNPQTDKIEDMAGQTVLPAEISPIDGKNTLYAIPRHSDAEFYAALGRNGLYYNFKGTNTFKLYEGVKKFGNRPVNNVFADKEVSGEGIEIDGRRVGHDGFLYVANGSKLTVLHRKTMEELASWNMPSADEDGNDIASSANFITVTSAPVGANGLSERTIAVAFGQAGVKIFKFMPKVKTVWEKDIE